MLTAQIDALVMQDQEQPCRDVDEALEILGKAARGKNVAEVRATLRLDRDLVMSCRIRDRGRAFSVDNLSPPKNYALSRDGLEKAFADVVRLLHDRNETALAAYTRLLEGRP